MVYSLNDVREIIPQIGSNVVMPTLDLLSNVLSNTDGRFNDEVAMVKDIKVMIRQLEDKVNQKVEFLQKG